MEAGEGKQKGYDTIGEEIVSYFYLSICNFGLVIFEVSSLRFFCLLLQLSISHFNSRYQLSSLRIYLSSLCKGVPKRNLAAGCSDAVISIYSSLFSLSSYFLLLFALSFSAS
ncbi:hypothetical protein B0T13DRAFT_159186 [Neurospora crassa]|nr:hypothetical protein B0T13DRAFT_159186 [Neurospora crassa]